MEALDRGVVAVPAADGGVLVRWRLRADDPDGVRFHVYRDGECLTDDPLGGATNYRDAEGSADATYAVESVVDGEAGERSGPVEVWADGYREVPLDRPADPDPDHDVDWPVRYVANDASAADLTGDGSYDIVLKWDPTDSKDNAHEGHTSPQILDGYTLDGEHLWRIDLGRNVRAGAHYTQFLVYDFDGDGAAEVAVRTADGTVTGDGETIGDPDADYRNHTGRVLSGPEYLSVFDGETGEELARTDYRPARGNVADWGDYYGNRVDRYLGAVAYLDGEHPSIVCARGYYEKTMLAAFDFRDGELSHRWTFDSDDGNEAYAGQGNHQLSVADVDGDGKDEIVYGACVIDHDGTGLYSTGWGHGDALHCGDLDPSREGLEVFQIHESSRAEHGASMRDAGTGDLIWGEHTGTDTGRGMAADIDPAHDGAECWALAGVGLRTVDGERIDDTPSSVNFGIWWTGDELRELLDHDFDREEAWAGTGKIDRWDPEAGELETLRTFEGTRSNNYTKGNPCLQADLLGDWREEVVWRTEDSEALRVYATPHETHRRLTTLMHDPQYRTAIAWQNVAYNQPPHPSFFIGDGMADQPERPEVDIADGS